jgi:citrate lyase subunit beta/citryl-CoA lyase
VEDIVRRSILIVSARDRDGVANSWRHGADAVALDLPICGPGPGRDEARTLVRESITSARRGGAEVFVRIDKDLAYADIEASAWPGLTGIILPGAETGDGVREVAAILAEMERRHGLPLGSLQLFLLLGTAGGVWNIRELLNASPRVSSVALDYSGLCRSLGILPQEDFDPFLFAAGRLVIECTAAGVEPVGISHPLSVAPRILAAEEIERLAGRGRNTGFKGAFCPHPSWVGPCNRAFTPTDDQIEYYHEVRRVFAEGVAQGRAAVPLDGRMLDVPVDERAKKQIALWERCRRRDAEKAAALEANAVA